MTETIITVRGEYSAWFPAERATVAVAISLEGPARGTVYEQVTESATTLRESIVAQHDAEAGPITWWSSDGVSVSSYRPWSQDGKRLGIVYNAAIGIRAKFSDFAALEQWIDEIALLTGVTISGIDWALTDATRDAVTADVRRRSVSDAVAKATTFAEAIGLDTVTPVAIADPGLLGNAAASEGNAYESRMMMKGMDVGGGAGLSLKPEEIEVSSVVDARFAAS